MLGINHMLLNTQIGREKQSILNKGVWDRNKQLCQHWRKFYRKRIQKRTGTPMSRTEST